MPHFNLPELRLNNLEFNRRNSNRQGIIVIAGDKCDVYADIATVETDDTRQNTVVQGTVILTGVSVVCSWQYLDDLSIHELREVIIQMAHDTIAECYNSIRWEAFVPQRNTYPAPEEIIDLTPPKVERDAPTGLWVCKVWSPLCRNYIVQTERLTKEEAEADTANF